VINFIRDRFGEIIIVLLVLGVIISFVITGYNRESRIVKGVVLEHGIVSDRNGDRTYITIIRTEDGFIEEKEGLNLYVIPINQRVNVKVYRWKKVNLKDYYEEIF
jgi:hypothetical protein